MARRRNAPPPIPPTLRYTTNDWLIVAVSVVIAILAFINTVNGEFVYDDLSQIVSNGLIQSPSQWGAALTSDVWAFRSAEGDVASNYWRPTFVIWLIINYALFGVNVVGWHWTNILLHAGCVALVYLLLRALKVNRWQAGAMTLLFAVHPVHTETVAWISGSPDLIMTLPFLGAWLVVWSARERPKAWKMPVAWGLMAIAIFAKESAVLLPVVLFVALWITDREQSKNWQSAAQKAAVTVAPFFGIAAIYFVLRLIVLGQFSQSLPWQWGPFEYLLTFPSILLFYLRQSLFPLWMGPSYPLRPVTANTIGVENFFIPLVVVILAGVLIWWVVRRGTIQQIGAALFLIPLLPTFHINAFLPEQIVHDRYLYLPVLGMLMMVIPTLAGLLKVAPDWNQSQKGWLLAGGVALYAVLLLGQTVRYNSAWTSEINLWTWAIESDPNSAFNWGEYGRVNYQADNIDTAKSAIERSLSITTNTPALLIRADIAAAEQRLDDAYNDLQTILTGQPNNISAIIRLSVVYQQAGRLEEAITLLESARQRLPTQTCALTTNLAVAYYLTNQKERTLSELEAMRPQTLTNSHPDCRRGLFHLAQLYEELGRNVEAQEVYEQFLVLTTGFTDDAITEYRNIALQRTGR